MKIPSRASDPPNWGEAIDHVDQSSRETPSLHYLLLTDSGEHECYEKASQVKTKDESELAMSDEMEFLMKNQT